MSIDFYEINEMAAEQTARWKDRLTDSEKMIAASLEDAKAGRCPGVNRYFGRSVAATPFANMDIPSAIQGVRLLARAMGMNTWDAERYVRDLCNTKDSWGSPTFERRRACAMITAQGAVCGNPGAHEFGQISVCTRHRHWLCGAVVSALTTLDDQPDIWKLIFDDLDALMRTNSEFACDLDRRLAHRCAELNEEMRRRIIDNIEDEWGSEQWDS